MIGDVLLWSIIISVIGTFLFLLAGDSILSAILAGQFYGKVILGIIIGGWFMIWKGFPFIGDWLAGNWEIPFFWIVVPILLLVGAYLLLAFGKTAIVIVKAII